MSSARGSDSRPKPSMAVARRLLCRQHWIFDLDGTLTQPLHDFAAMRRQLGVPVDRGILEYIQALPEPERGRRDRQLVAMEVEVARRALPNPGVRELLLQLQADGVQLGILTRNRRDCVVISLQRLEVFDLFADAAIIACEDVSPKPDPEGVHRLLKLWGAAPEDTLIVGDFRYDLEAGRAAGIATVQLDMAGQGRWPELTDLAATSLVQLRHWRGQCGSEAG